MPSVHERNGHDLQALFVDRDGVLNRLRPDHVKTWAEFDFLPGALGALAELRRMGVRMVVITNQSAVGRGLLTLGELHSLHARMMAAIADAGGDIEAVYACPHAPEERCRCRKPGTQLLIRVGCELGLRLDQSVMIGDSWSDVIAARGVGCRPILIDGRGSRKWADDPPVVASLGEAVDLVVEWRQEHAEGC